MNTITQQRVDFGPSYNAEIEKLIGFRLNPRAIICQMGERSGVTPFRAFRMNGIYIVLVEGIHSEGSIISTFDNASDYDAWKHDHMHIDISRKDW